jgi:hypothetical protein
MRNRLSATCCGVRTQERILHGGLDQTSLEFVRERAGGQSQRPIQRKDTGHAWAGVAHANQFDGPKDGSKRTGAQPSVRVSDLATLLPEVKSGTHIPVAALLQVSLKKQALHLPSTVLLPGLDLVEGKLQGAAGGQP